LAHLAAWQTLGAPDIPFTQRRVRWAAVGTGTQPETVNVTQLNTPALVSPGIYLGAINGAEFPALQRVRFFKEFTESEISLPGLGLPVVPVTEVGLFVDVYPASTGGGVDDAATGAFDTTLNPATATNPPVSYKTFDVISKTVDFKLEITWDYIFG
jgi:hypothetical protein